MRRSKVWFSAALLLAMVTGAVPVHASETQTYTYDARGRLVKVDHGTTGPNAGVKSAYTYDAADNRTQVVATMLALIPASLPGGTHGTAYNQTISAVGGSGTGYTFSVTSGTLPPGLTLAASTGVLSGTPSQVGTHSFTVTATDSAANTGSQAYSVTIAGVSLTLSPTSLPSGTVGTAYSRTITASGGSGSGYTFTVSSGLLPTGLSLNSTGVVSGTPSTAGTYSFTAKATDSAGNTGTRSYSVTIASATTTINLTSADHNLRTVANANGYTGSSSANYKFVVGSTVRINGPSGSGAGIDTGTWPSGVTLTLQVSGTVSGGGGKGGNGATTASYGLVTAGTAGGAGGDAIKCHAPIGITVATGGIVESGGGGGGGGGYSSQQGGPGQIIYVGGAGGGGGAPNGAGGAAGTSYGTSNPGAGSPGTISGGGAPGLSGMGGGPGGTYATAGIAGPNGNVGPYGGAGGAAGYAVRKNGTGCTVSGAGTIKGTVG